MLVVADASPINVLVRIEQSEILPQLFERVAIPGTVLAELSAPGAPEVVRMFIRTKPDWLEVREPSDARPVEGVDAGESAAIRLATELGVPLLIDDLDGRRVARSIGLVVIGTLGAIERASAKSLIDLPSVLAAIQATDFRLHGRLVREALDRHRGRTGGA